MKMNLRWMFFGLVLCGSLVIGVGTAWSAPGLLQQATRSGFWGNDFPDGAMLIQHFYHYTSDEAWDGKGDKQKTQDTTIEASYTRLIRSWHSGDDNKYQYILEAIIPAFNVSIKESSSGAGDNFSVSGLGNPFIYGSVGWNNPSKTTHLQSFLLWQVPFGDDDLQKAGVIGNNHAIMPGVAAQYRFGNVWVEGSMGYQYNFEDLDSDKKARDVFEFSPIVTYRFTSSAKPWWVYLQGDYTKYMEGDDAQGNGLDNDGYNISVTPGIGFQFRPNMTLDVKYAMDVDGENTLKGNAINARFFWFF